MPVIVLESGDIDYETFWSENESHVTWALEYYKSGAWVDISNILTVDTSTVTDNEKKNTLSFQSSLVSTYRVVFTDDRLVTNYYSNDININYLFRNIQNDGTNDYEFRFDYSDISSEPSYTISYKYTGVDGAWTQFQFFIELPGDDKIITIDPSYLVSSSTVSTDNMTMTNTQRKLVVDGCGVYHAVYTKTLGIKKQVYYSNSLDNGVTWGNETNISTSMDYNNYYPAIAVDSQNHLHVVWYAYDATYATDTQIFYSTYDGTSWSTPVALTTNVNREQQYPVIAVDSNDHLHVAWHGKTDIYTMKYNIRYTNSINNGTTWNTIVEVTAEIRANIYPTIAIDNFDIIHISYAGMDDGSGATKLKYCNARHSSTYFTDGLMIWSTEQTLTTDNDYDQEAPNIVVEDIINDQNTIHIVWQGTTLVHPDYRNIRYSKSTDGGITWSTPMMLTTDDSYHQDCATINMANDALFIVWNGKYAPYISHQQLRAKRYTSSGSWTTIINLTADAEYDNQFPVLMHATYPYPFQDKHLCTSKTGFTFLYTKNGIGVRQWMNDNDDFAATDIQSLFIRRYDTNINYFNIACEDIKICVMYPDTLSFVDDQEFINLDLWTGEDKIVNLAVNTDKITLHGYELNQTIIHLIDDMADHGRLITLSGFNNTDIDTGYYIENFTFKRSKDHPDAWEYSLSLEKAS